MVEETRRVVRVKIPTLICRRCSKRWLPRTTEVRRCPACKSPDWNTPRPTRIQRLDCRRSARVEAASGDAVDVPEM